MEPGLLPVLDRQGADPVQPAGCCSSARRSTCSTCGPWARRSARVSSILSPVVPVCTDLLTIGAGTIIRKDTAFTGYRAHGGMIQTGPVTLGSDVLIGEATVLDIGTSMGDGAQLGHASCLDAGQSVPAGEQLARVTGAGHRCRLPGGGPGTVRQGAAVRLQRRSARQPPGPVRARRSGSALALLASRCCRIWSSRHAHSGRGILPRSARLAFVLFFGGIAPGLVFVPPSRACSTARWCRTASTPCTASTTSCSA